MTGNHSTGRANNSAQSNSPAWRQNFGRATASDSTFGSSASDRGQGNASIRRGNATNIESFIRNRRGVSDASAESQSRTNVPRGNVEGTPGGHSQWNRFRGEHAAGRPTNERVREFLQLRRDAAVNQAENRGDRQFDNNLHRRDGDTKQIGRMRAEDRASVHGNRINRSHDEGDRAWARRFGHAKLERGDRTGRHDDHGQRDGRAPRDRKVGDRDEVQRHYSDWRKHAWRGERGHGHDHRDQSGRWRDGDRFHAAHRIRDHWKRHRGHHDLPFHGGWWNNHHRHHRHWNHWDHFAHRHHRPFYWWSWATAPRLTAWVSYGWPTPYYWDYGPGEYIYCYDDVIYVNGVWFQPAPIYHEQTLVLAQRAPDWTPEQAAAAEWLPLGVFAVARDGVADTNALLQLAVTQEGVIGGTVFNQLTGATFAIEGTVDKDTQRAVWTYVDETNTRIAMETSVFNLTQPEATGLIHYGPDNIQVIELVRLEEPGDGTSLEAGPSLAPAVTP